MARGDLFSSIGVSHRVGARGIKMKLHKLIIGHMPNKDVYYNHSNKVIFITAGVIPDPLGGPGKGEVTYSIVPGDGIDLSILGLKREKPDG